MASVKIYKFNANTLYSQQNIGLTWIYRLF